MAQGSAKTLFYHTGELSSIPGRHDSRQLTVIKRRELGFTGLMVVGLANPTLKNPFTIRNIQKLLSTAVVCRETGTNMKYLRVFSYLFIFLHF